ISVFRSNSAFHRPSLRGTNEVSDEAIHNKIEHFKRLLRSWRSLAMTDLKFKFPDPNKKLLVRFAKRLERHKDEIFTFQHEKGVDYHNKHAE
ncbi:MAG: hypothetical protein WCV56_08380, partial [Candidatus Omnitrophota bacterium]